MSTQSNTPRYGLEPPRRREARGAGFAVFLATVAFGAGAQAQSLAVFLAGSESHSPERREADATVRQRGEETTQSIARLLPALAVSAGYTRNQQAVELTLPSDLSNPAAGQRTVTINPRDQLDATVRLEVPLVDVGAWQRVGAARANEDAARERARATADDVQRSVVRSYFQWAGATALVTSARRALDVAERSLARANARSSAGLGSVLDVRRAEAEVARARQSLAEARVSAENAAHALTSATGVPAVEPLALDDDLREEAPLASWESSSAAQPSVRAAVAEARAAEAQQRAGWSGLAPTLTGTLQERFTNAAGFGLPAFFSAGVSLAWRLDGTVITTARASEASRAAAEARADRALRAARDAVFTDWNTVRANLERARAARAQEASAEAAAEEARDRRARGTATEYDTLLAERDAFAARVARIQADADLMYSRALLRIDAGRAPAPEGTRAPWR